MLYFKNEEQVIAFLEQMGWYHQKIETYQFSNEPFDSVFFTSEVFFEKNTLDEVYELANTLYEEAKERFSKEGSLDWLYEWMGHHLDVHQLTIEG